MMKALVLGCAISVASLGVALAQNAAPAPDAAPAASDAAPAPEAGSKVVAHKHKGATKKKVVKKHPAKKVEEKHDAE